MTDQTGDPVPSAPPPPPAAEGPPRLTVQMLQHLRATKPWVRLMSVVCFATAALCAIMGLGVMALGVLGLGPWGRLGALAGVAYVAFGVVYIFPAVYLSRYAGAIRGLLISGQASAMEAALGHQKSFWRFIGIMTLVFLCLYALVLVALLAMGMVGFFGL